MTDDPLRMLLVVGIVVAMVSLVWATVQPSRQSVWSAVVCLALLPVAFVVLAVVVWAMGR